MVVLLTREEPTKWILLFTNKNLYSQSLKALLQHYLISQVDTNTNNFEKDNKF